MSYGTCIQTCEGMIYPESRGGKKTPNRDHPLDFMGENPHFNGFSEAWRLHRPGEQRLLPGPIRALICHRLMQIVALIEGQISVRDDDIDETTGFCIDSRDLGQPGRMEVYLTDEEQTTFKDDLPDGFSIRRPRIGEPELASSPWILAGYVCISRYTTFGNS